MFQRCVGSPTLDLSGRMIQIPKKPEVVLGTFFWADSCFRRLHPVANPSCHGFGWFFSKTDVNILRWIKQTFWKNLCMCQRLRSNVWIPVSSKSSSPNSPYIYASYRKKIHPSWWGASSHLKHMSQIGSFPHKSGWAFEKSLSCHHRAHLCAAQKIRDKSRSLILT